ncbi:MAG: ParB/RepB/Spo0J family partition protein [bacterium]|nr:ParB/RepB/Spo0J family partition protein [bacterium]
MSEMQMHNPVFLIEVEKIKPNPQQPRKVFDEDALNDLASSIREFGLLQPITVSKNELETPTGTAVEYILIAGERRLMACKKLGLERIPAIVKNVSLGREQLELAIIENIQRENLNPIESARAFAKLQDQFGLTQREIATRIGKSRETVANTVRLLNLPTEIQEAVSKSLISESQARLLLAIAEPDKQQMLFNDIIRNSLSVRDLKSRIDQLKKSEVASDQVVDQPVVDLEAQLLQKELEAALGTKVKLEKTGATGKITIAFYSSEELQGLIDKLVKKHDELSSPPPSTFSV